MTLFYVDDQSFIAKPGETILDTLLRCGYPANYSCKKGRCRSCLLQYVAGDLAQSSQRGLNQEQKKSGLIFACQCIPASGLMLSSPEYQMLYTETVKISAIEQLADNIVAVSLSLNAAGDYYPGQCINLRREDGIGRTYAIVEASDHEICIHVQRKRNGIFSQWLYSEANIDDQLELQGPWGNCRYYPSLTQDKLILIGTGTGLGAVAGIAKAALTHDHVGEIYLYHAAQNIEQLYLHKKMLEQVIQYRNFFYQPCITNTTNAIKSDDNRIQQIHPLTLLKSQHELSRQHRIFLCGDSQMVLKGQEQVFLAGVPIERIHVLPFDYRELRKQPRIWS